MLVACVYHRYGPATSWCFCGTLWRTKSEHQRSPINLSRSLPFGPADKQSLTIHNLLSERHQRGAPVHPRPPGLPDTPACPYPSTGGPVDVSHYELCICVLRYFELVPPLDYACMFVSPHDFRPHG